MRIKRVFSTYGLTDEKAFLISCLFSFFNSFLDFKTDLSLYFGLQLLSLHEALLPIDQEGCCSFASWKRANA